MEGKLFTIIICFLICLPSSTTEAALKTVDGGHERVEAHTVRITDEIT